MKVNPIHFKPTWIFGRFPDECDDLVEEFGKNCLALSDAEMISIRLLVSEFIKTYEGDSDRRISAIWKALVPVEAKLEAMLNDELGL